MKPELESLTQRYLDGSLSAEEMSQLNRYLNDSSAARRDFVELLNLDSAVKASAAGWERQQMESPVKRSPSRTLTASPSARRWLAAAACLSFLASAGWWWQDSQRLRATVVKVAGVEELAQGTMLKGETHSLKGGSVELLTSRGARIVIEAPAEFRFESAQRLRLLKGRLSAEVPPAAKGFTVVTPSGDAVDLGTRFGVDVPVSGAAEIHVFQGEVIAKTSGNKNPQSLRGGEAVAMDGGASTARELRSSAFIQTEEMNGLSAGLAAGQRARSAAALSVLRQDPALITLLDFEANVALPGVFRLVQGRWPGSQAPEFVNQGDHLQLDVGGDREWPQLSLAAWVRLDHLGAPYQSLLHTDGWNQGRPGQVHWMVTKLTTMRLALFANTLAPGADELNGFPDSRTSVLPEQGRWVHLATVYDSAAKTVRFYLNGRFDKETRQAIAHPARLGPAQIGNWDRQDRKLSGRVDELLILGRAMSDDEVRALFEAGNPYR